MGVYRKEFVQFCYKSENLYRDNNTPKNYPIKVGIQIDDEFGQIIDLNANEAIIPFQIKLGLDKSI